MKTLWHHVIFVARQHTSSVVSRSFPLFTLLQVQTQLMQCSKELSHSTCITNQHGMEAFYLITYGLTLVHTQAAAADKGILQAACAEHFDYTIFCYQVSPASRTDN